LLSNKINPFKLIHRLPYLKRLYEKQGINIRNSIDEAFKRPDIGLSSIWAGGFMYILVFFMCLGTLIFFSVIIQKDFLKFYNFIILLIITLLVNHFLLFKRNKYLKYFKEFEEMPKNVKKKWAWISFVVIIGIWSFCIGSFVFMLYRFKK
jgi:glucan phosphoethanolaminetransferase (alkaline phosphatase superfamily)